MSRIPEQFDLEKYRFELPERLIAQHPSEKRQESSLLVVDRQQNALEHSQFARLHEHLASRSLLVLNESSVFPARLRGCKEDTAGAAEFLLTTPLPLVQPEPQGSGAYSAQVEGLVRPAKSIRENQVIRFGPNLSLTVGSKKQYGRISGRLTWKGSLSKALHSYGLIPLPPYIKRDECQVDRERYQTVYACEDKNGSVAAPTAGLHFTKELLEDLRNRGLENTRVTLHVGSGTFSPIRSRDIREHAMHAEYIEVDLSAARAVNAAKKEGRPVVAVGTTSVRALESAADEEGWVRPFSGWTDLFIYPGYRFKTVDQTITNFHLPGSSLILMMSAFAGRDLLLQAYQAAIARQYRFYSYGDCMLIR